MWVTSAENCENSQVVVVIYGDKGNSGPIILGSSQDAGLFQQGNVDEFKVNLAKIGKLYKIRMELDALTKKADPIWKIKEVRVAYIICFCYMEFNFLTSLFRKKILFLQVKMQDMNTKETLKFKYNRWLSRKHDDGEVMRELPAIRPSQQVLPGNSSYVILLTIPFHTTYLSMGCH